VDNFEAGRIAHRAFKSGVLIAADNEGVTFFRLHGSADIGVAAIDFL